MISLQFDFYWNRSYFKFKKQKFMHLWDRHSSDISISKIANDTFLSEVNEDKAEKILF